MSIIVLTYMYLGIWEEFISILLRQLPQRMKDFAIGLLRAYHVGLSSDCAFIVLLMVVVTVVEALKCGG